MSRMFIASVAALALVGVGVAAVVAHHGARGRVFPSPSATQDAVDEDALGETELLEEEGLPSVVPTLTVEGLRLDPLYLSWHTPDGGRRTIIPPEDTTAADYPTVPTGRALVVTLDSPVRPAIINARFYHRLGPDGLPADTEDSHVECLGQGAPCPVSATDTHVTVKTEADQAAVFTVVEVFYHNPGVSRAVPYSVVTYGFNSAR